MFIVDYDIENIIRYFIDEELEKELPLQKEIKQFIKGIITSKNPIKSQAETILPTIFNFRIKSIEWLSENNQLDYLEKSHSVINEFLPKVNLERDSTFIENIKFCLRCNKRVADAFLEDDDKVLEESVSYIKKNKESITYEKTIFDLFNDNHDKEVIEDNIHFIQSLLYIEFVVICAYLIYHNKIKVSDKTMDELTELAAEAGQNHIAYALSLGIVKQRSYIRKEVSKENDEVSRENNSIAEQGLSDFLNLYE